MPFTPKNWQDTPSTTTPITAAALEDLETRVTDYADTAGGSPQNVYIQETEPVAPTIPSLWIPIDEDGVPLSTDQWQVYTEP
jgi:hypothetical protein